MEFKEFKKKYVKKDVTEYPNNTPSKPVISVFIITYNHENYIKDAIEGVLKQETEFEYEIIIGEDESSDNTRKICIEYAEKYPDKIRLLLSSRDNNIKLNGKPTGRFLYIYMLYEIRGKYVAVCDGDDYWTSPKKLQTQVSFLENNPEYNVTFHNTSYLKDGQIHQSKINTKKSVFTNKEFILGLPMPKRALSLIYRKSALPKTFPESWVIDKAPLMDWLIFFGSSLNGLIKYFHKDMGVYRLHSGGIWSSKVDVENIDTIIQFRTFLAEKIFNNDKKVQSNLYASIIPLKFRKVESLIRDSKHNDSFSVLKKINILEVIKLLKPYPIKRIIKVYLNLLLRSKI